MRFFALLPLFAAAALATHESNKAKEETRRIREEHLDAVEYNGPKVAVAIKTQVSSSNPAPNGCQPYWLENIRHQGIAAFNPDASYKVFRNVKDYGAVGDGVTDDTDAIQRAVSDGNRCAPGQCQSTTTTQALVYFPSGTYLISRSIIDYYITQLIGNPNCPPVLKATPNFVGFGLIDGDQYQAGGVLGFGATNVFFRQIINFVLDMTAIPGSSAATGIHWPTAQATSIQNVKFLMSEAPGNQHQGIFIESGSAGIINDLEFHGGLVGANLGNQQYTMRNLTFYNAATAINMLFDWGWTFESISIYNCSVGIDMTSGGPKAQNVGSITLFDSSMTDVPLGIKTAYGAGTQPPTAGSVILENVQFNNVPVIVQGQDGVALQGSTGVTNIAAWGEGHAYSPDGPTQFQGTYVPPKRPASLLSNGKYYQRSKPLYGDVPIAGFMSVRDAGAKGDGLADDTVAIQNVINSASKQGKIVFFDAGTYKVTKTILIPAGIKITGEAYPVIMSSGPFFNDINKPQPVLQVGKKGQEGAGIEWSNMIVSTQGGQAGAILIQFNLATKGVPSAMWDVHTRIGGFAGSQLQLADCPTTPTVMTPPAAVNPNCIAAYMSMHITKSASNLYMENNWLWTADHDIDSSNNIQITIYTGRGLLIESEDGTIWLWGTAVEHHALYQYQLSGTKNLFMGQIQTETPYYQPNPNATIPFPAVRSLKDPDFVKSCKGVQGNCADAWGLRILDSSNILTYGAGLYSFFNNYSTKCSDFGNGEACQQRIFDLEGDLRNVWVYNLNTIGATSMIDLNGKSIANYADNIDWFPDTIALFHI